MKLNVFMRFALAFGLVVAAASCGDKNELKPETSVKAADWQEVSSSEGVLEKNDITVEFPRGTFQNGEKVAISTVKPGLVGGEREVSEFYQITLPKTGTAQPSTIIINCPEAGADKVVVVRTPSWNRHTGKNEYMTATLLAKYNSDKGYMKVTLPEVDPCEDENPFFSIGIIQGYTEADTKAAVPAPESFVSEPEDLPQTKASSSYNYRYTWAMDTFSHAAFLVYSTKYSYINNFLSTNIPEAHRILEGLKFKLPDQTIIYKVEEFGADETAWGFMQSSKFVTSWGYIRLNAKMLYEFAKSDGTSNYTTSAGQIQQTLVHETSHAVQEFSYDPRTAPVRNAAGLLGDEWAMLSEAIGCWTEKFTGDKRISENTPFFGLPFTKEFWPHEKSWSTYQEHGYGLGFFIDHLATTLGNDKIAQLYQNQHDKTATSVLDDFNKIMSGTKLSTFLTDFDQYNKFLEDIYTGKKDSRAEIQRLVDAKKFTGNTMTLDGGVHKLGVLLHKVSIPKDILEKNINYTLKVTQPNDNFTTYGYFRKGESNYSLVIVSSDDISDEVSVKDLQQNGGLLYFATVINPSNDIDFEYNLVKNDGAYAKVNLEFTKPDNTVPNIWSVSLEGDVINNGKTLWINEGWTSASEGGMSTITVKKVSNGFEVHADDGEYYAVTFTITKKGNGFGDVINLKNERYNDADRTFTLDKLPLQHFDDGHDASHGDASWEYTVPGARLYLDVYFNRLY